MANIAPFQPYRYTAAAGELRNVVTQPYDKISPEMQAAYLAASPYNLVRVILGQAQPADTPTDNVYSRAAGHLQTWIRDGVLAREAAPSIYPYFQSFADPETGAATVRKGFIALGALEPYEAGVVHRHELTLSGPKKDRSQLLRATRAHFGQIFMLYSDAERVVDAVLEEVAKGPALAEVTDEYGVLHQIWRITDTGLIGQIRNSMASRKLVIADGHHRYETALAFKQESGVDHVMMTFVNTQSPGLRILATHRVLRNLTGFDTERLIQALSKGGQVERVADDAALKAALDAVRPGEIAVGFVTSGASVLVRAPAGTVGLDVDYLHGTLLPTLGIEAEAVRDEQFLKYVRGVDKAIAEVRQGGAQAAFLLRPSTPEQIMEISLGGGVMPQKATDFYPKLLSGLTIWKIDE